MIDKDIADRVADGARLLDRIEPDWAGRIKLDRLAMDRCDRCILGQLYGSYTRGFCRLIDKDLGRWVSSAVSLGFTSIDNSYREEMEEYRQLGNAWRSEVRKRLDGSEAAR